MPDLFGRVDQVFGGGLSSDAMFMTFPGLAAVGNGAGLLIQNITLQYSQPVRRIFELGPGQNGNQLTYYIVGRPEGNAQIARIFGITAIAQAFYETYGDPCDHNDITLSADVGCGEGSGQATWDLTGFLLTGMSMTATAQEMIIQESVTAMFVGLTLTEQSNSSAPAIGAGGGGGGGADPGAGIQPGDDVIMAGGNPGGGGGVVI